MRLYDVIETDKYIGIIIEYASGGELFDHILAHRYLRERDAAKLFSQLISGVWYIHQKKIVHRDLKLENLLLDRHRNVIITDFGFANRFEHRADDLMQTSCGSPCYAAPELVISEGLYVGSAVDIWSCGVILYAMLAGYLPFDDDPANPDGDNINLLYKYIVNTPLSFPEYVSESARDLLSMMLVPDPTRRASLSAVMKHPWLAAYAIPITDPGKPTAFGRTVDELERAALEQHQQKRLAYQKTMRAAASSTSPSTVSRTQSHRPEGSSSTSGGVPMATSATGPPSSGRRNQEDYIYSSASPSTMAVDQAPPPASAPVRGGYTPVVDDDDPFAAPGSVSSPHIEVPLSPESAGARGKKSSTATRHTIQVEYGGAPSPAPKRGREEGGSGGRDKRQKERSASRGPGTSTTERQQQPPPSASANGTSGKRRTSDASVTKPLPPSPTKKGNPSKTSNQEPPSIILADATGETSEVIEKESQTSSRGSGGSGKHRRGPSALGGLAKIFGTNGEVNGASHHGVPSPTTPNASGSLLSPDKEKHAHDSKEKDPKKASRRNTLTVMVEPISRTIKNRRAKGATTPLNGPESTVEEKKVVPPTTPLPTFDTTGITAKDETDHMGRHTLQASTNKARGVMQWFRSKSKGRESIGLMGDPAAVDERGVAVPVTPYRKKNAAASSSTVNQLQQQANAATPSPTSATPTRENSNSGLLTATPAPKTPGAASGKVQRTPSSVTDASSVTPSFVTRFRNSVTVGVGGGSKDSSHAKVASGNVLRIHHGAVDQNMITTRPPPEVMRRIKELLLEMGIEVQIESDFKYRCIRAKRRKGAGGSSALGSISGGGLTAFTMVGSAASNGVRLMVSLSCIIIY